MCCYVKIAIIHILCGKIGRGTNNQLKKPFYSCMIFKKINVSRGSSCSLYILYYRFNTLLP